MRRIVLALFYGVWAVILLFGGGRVATAADPCLECHGLIGFGIDGHPMWVHADSYAFSVHRNLTCADCHKGAQGFPHEANLRVRCDLPCHVEGASHEKVARQVEGSVHAVLGAPACLACHPEGGAPAPAERSRRCDGCHAGLDRPRSVYPDSAGAFGFRAHQPTARAKAQGARLPDCVDCHGAHGVQPGEAARSACAAGGCHPREGENFGVLFDHSGDRDPLLWGGAGSVLLLLGAALSLVLGVHILRRR